MLYLIAHNGSMSPEREQFVARLLEVVALLKYADHGRQTALARRYKIKQPSVRKWFTGEAMPSYEIAKDLCTRAQVAYEWLMTGRGKKFHMSDEVIDPKILAALNLLNAMSQHQVNQAIKIIATIAEPAAANGNGDF